MAVGVEPDVLRAAPFSAVRLPPFEKEKGLAAEVKGGPPVPKTF